MVADFPSEDVTPGPIPGYRILQKIGTGGLGDVYLAIDHKKERKVALKVFSFNETLKQPEMLVRFKAELRSGRRVKDENVARLYHFGRQGDICYLAMEFVDGVKLDDYVKERGRLSNAQAIEFMVQATRAIQHLYHSGIIHRDIKPSNFLVTRQDGKDRTKLIDLGVRERPVTTGSIDYMSPEHIRDGSVPDCRSNIYSLGCMWYHLLAGHAPFDEGTTSERLKKHLEEDPKPIAGINPDVALGAARILSRMLAKDPEERYSDLSALLGDLRKEFSVWQLADPAVPVAPAEKVGHQSAGVVGRSIRLRKGRRHFTSLEHEKKRASSPLFNRRPKRKLPFLIMACCRWLKRLVGRD
jgi:serine/threonine-protein kinase